MKFSIITVSILLSGCWGTEPSAKPAQAELTQDAGTLDHVSCTRICDYFDDHHAMPDVACVQMCEYLVSANPDNPPVNCQDVCAHY